MEPMRKGDVKQDCIKIGQNSSIYNNPIALLRAIKWHSSNYQEMRYEMAIVSDGLLSKNIDESL